MSIDAVALFRPKNLAALRPYLDLDEDSEESNGLYAEALDDGSLLVHTFQSYAAFAESPIEGRAWLAQFGADLPQVHEDPRGLLFFPDVAEPSGRTYDAVVAEVGAAGVWIPATALTADEAHAREAQLVVGVAEIQQGDALPPLDMAGLPAMAQQLFASMNLGSPDGPTDINQIMAALQKQLMGAMGDAMGASGADLDAEFPGDEDDEEDELDPLDAAKQATLRKLLGPSSNE